MVARLVDLQTYLRDPIELDIDAKSGVTVLKNGRWPQYAVFAAKTIECSPLLKSSDKGTRIRIDVANGNAEYEVHGRDVEGRVFCELVMGARRG